MKVGQRKNYRQKQHKPNL